MGTITKIGGVIFNSAGNVLVVEKNWNGISITPGGKPEANESDESALRREVHEEVGLKLEHVVYFGTYRDKAAFENADIVMRVYMSQAWYGTPRPLGEITRCAWIGADYAARGIKVGSILSRHIMPALQSESDGYRSTLT